MKRKIVSLLLVLVMVFSITACGKKEEENPGGTTPDTTTTKAPDNKDEGTGDDNSTVPSANLDDIIPDKTVELTVYSQLANYSGEMVGWFAKVMLDKFNVKINIIQDGDGVFATRMASGNLGDIIAFGDDGDEYDQAVRAGMLFDWEEDDLLDEYGTYIKENMPKALEKNREISGGSLYGYGHNVSPSADDHESFFYYPDVRWDLYAQLGYPEINTLEDYIDLLEQMVAIEPTSDTGGKTYGVSLFPDWDGDMVMFVKSTAGLYGYDEFGFGLYDTKTQTYEGCLDEDGMYIRCLKFYNTLYRKGLMNPDSMTQTFNDVMEHYQTGAAFFNLFNWMGSGFYNSEAHLAEGKAMMPLAAKDAKNIVYGLNVFGANRVWAIGSKTDYPELCMAILDWLSTPEGRMTLEYGPRGACWEYDDNNDPYLTELGVSCKASGETQMPAEWGGGTWQDGSFQINNTTWALDAENPETNGSTYNYLFWESTLQKGVSEIEQDWRDFTDSLSPDEYLEKNGYYSIAIGTSYSTTPRSDELQITWEQVATCIKDGSWSAIYAKTDEEFDQIVIDMRNRAVGYGYDDCIAFTQGEAERRAQLENEAKK